MTCIKVLLIFLGILASFGIWAIADSQRIK